MTQKIDSMVGNIKEVMKMNAKRIQVGSHVMVGKYPCKVLSIVEEDGIIYYEVKPMEFETFSRFVTTDSIEIRDDDDE